MAERQVTTCRHQCDGFKPNLRGNEAFDARRAGTTNALGDVVTNSDSERQKMTRTFRLAVFIVIVGLGFATTAAVAGEKSVAPAKTPTVAELRARLAALEQELAGVRQDYGLLLTTTCQTPQPGQSAGTAADIERATLAAKQQAITDANDRAYEEQVRRLEDMNWYVKDPTFGVTEQNNVFFRFGWNVTINNAIPRRQIYDVEVQFLDDRGLIVHTDRLYGQVIQGQAQQVLRGDALIRVPAALMVSKIHVVATRHQERP
jgi:hypothetical protein